MRPLIELLNAAIADLSTQEIPNPRRQAEELLSHLLNIPRVDLYLQHDHPLSQDEQSQFQALIKRRLAHEPLAYILGTQPFLDIQVTVNPSVLIPRAETEYMTHQIIQTLEKHSRTNKILWDLCTGSGCMGIALKARFPELNVTLSDLSPDALRIASDNASLNHVDVSLLEGDLFTPFQGQRAHYIVCNPPYIDPSEKLESEVIDYEPFQALFASSGGLEFYDRLSEALPSHLYPGGMCWLEMGSTQSSAVKEIFSQGAWSYVGVRQDLSGHDRFVHLIL